MSVAARFRILCDGCLQRRGQDPNCHEAFVSDAASVHNARNEARAAGWKRGTGGVQDLCPTCYVTRLAVIEP